LAFTVLYKSGEDLQKKVSLVKELVGEKGASNSNEPLMLYNIDFPKVGFTPSPTDWSIIKSLRYNALKPEREIAEEIGISLPTVKKRLQKLVSGKLIFILPIFNGQMVSNLILYALLLIPDSTNEDIIMRVTETFREDSYYRIISPSGAIIFLMYAKRMADAEESYIKAQKLAGIKQALMDFAGESHDCSGSIDSLIKEKTRN
jgi:DNA-binding Lrp family transcriptional regulator